MDQVVDRSIATTGERKVLLPQDALLEIRELCGRFGVTRVILFGSANTDQFDPERSDIDLIVEFDKSQDQPLLANFFGMHAALEDLFARRVDMRTKTSIENPYLRRSIELNHRQLYPSQE